MKNKLSLLAAAVAVAVFSLSALAVPPDPLTGFSATTTNGATTLSYAVVSANSANGGAPAITYLNAGSDLASAKLQFYKVTSLIQATGAGSTTRLDVNGTNTGVNWQSGQVIIRHMADDSYEKRILAANTGSTNIIVTVAPMGTMAAGDIIYYAVTAGGGTINWGALTNGVGPGNYIYVGQPQKPLLLEINATTAGAINVGSGVYLPPRPQ